MPITPHEFARICFIVLMQNGDGIIDKAPDYITEKASMLFMGLDAFAMLDIHNMRKVKEWCETWSVEMPEPCAKYLTESEEAFQELKDRGMNI